MGCRRPPTRRCRWLHSQPTSPPLLSSPPRRGTYDELLAAPAGDDATAPTGTVVRSAAAYTPKDDRFLLKSRDYERQYAQLYFYRLQQLRGVVEAAARKAWPGIEGERRGGARLLRACRDFALLASPNSTCHLPDPHPSPHTTTTPLAVVRILQVPEEGEVAIAGTLYKEMALKPSILDEYVKDRTMAQQLGRARFTQPDDRWGWWGWRGCRCRLS